MLRALHRKGIPIPASMQAPVLAATQHLVWEAFCDLNRSRPYSMEPLGIPLQEIKIWFEFRQIYDPYVRGDLYYLIAALDVFWLQFHRDHTADQTKDKPHANR